MMEIQFISGNMDEALAVISEAAAWLRDTGRQMWDPDELKPENLDYRPEDYVVAIADGKAAAAMVLCYEDKFYWPQLNYGESAFIHKLAVSRDFAGKGMAAKMVEYAVGVCRDKGIGCLRLDTEAKRDKLCAFYEGLGFEPVKRQYFDIPHQGRCQMVLYALNI